MTSSPLGPMEQGDFIEYYNPELADRTFTVKPDDAVRLLRLGVNPYSGGSFYTRTEARLGFGGPLRMLGAIQVGVYNVSSRKRVRGRVLGVNGVAEINVDPGNYKMRLAVPGAQLAENW